MKSKTIFLSLLAAAVAYLPLALPAQANNLNLNISSPAAGQIWPAGSTQTINWSLSNQPVYQPGQARPTIFIQLNSASCSASGVVACNPPATPYIVAENISNTGSYKWNVPTQLNLTYQGPVTLTVGLSDSSGEATSSQFYLVAASSYLSAVPLIAPNGGEQWTIGSNQTIRWSNASSTTANVNINLVPINLLSCGNSPCSTTASFAYPVATNVPNNGSYSWYISNTLNGQTVPLGTYAISLTDPVNGNVLASSAGTFSLGSGAQGASPVSASSTASMVPNISAVSPNSGPVGQLVNIIGSGFTSTGNNIQFGPGSYINGISSNGTSIQFGVPGYTQPCPPNSSGPCPLAISLITPGAYGVSVTNPNRTSNTMPFEVTGNIQSSSTIPSVTAPGVTANPGMPIGFADGTLVMVSGNPTVYLVSNGQFRPFNSAAIFLSLGYQWTQIQTITRGQLNPQYVSAIPVPAANGSIIKTADNPTVYLIVNGQKSAIPSLAVFNSLNLNFQNLITLSDQDLQSYPTTAMQQ